MATGEPLPLRIVGFPGDRGYVLAEAVSAMDDELHVVVLAQGMTSARGAPSPAPAGEGTRLSGDEWAARMGLLGLFDGIDADGEPVPHPDG